MTKQPHKTPGEKFRTLLSRAQPSESCVRATAKLSDHFNWVAHSLSRLLETAETLQDNDPQLTSRALIKEWSLSDRYDNDHKFYHIGPDELEKIPGFQALDKLCRESDVALSVEIAEHNERIDHEEQLITSFKVKCHLAKPYTKPTVSMS